MPPPRLKLLLILRKDGARKGNAAAPIISEDVGACLLSVAHSAVCFRNKLGLVWYEGVMKALRTCVILGGYTVRLALDVTDGDCVMEAASYALFAEIMVVVSRFDALPLSAISARPRTWKVTELVLAEYHFRL